MGDITYVSVRGAGAIHCKVRLDKKIVGAIYKTVDEKFYYRPTGRGCGDVFPTIEAVKLSIEG